MKLKKIGNKYNFFLFLDYKFRKAKKSNDFNIEKHKVWKIKLKNEEKIKEEKCSEKILNI